MLAPSSTIVEVYFNNKFNKTFFNWNIFDCILNVEVSCSMFDVRTLDFPSGQTALCNSAMLLQGCVDYQVIKLQRSLFNCDTRDIITRSLSSRGAYLIVTLVVFLSASLRYFCHL